MNNNPHSNDVHANRLMARSMMFDTDENNILKTKGVSSEPFAKINVENIPKVLIHNDRTVYKEPSGNYIDIDLDTGEGTQDQLTNAGMQYNDMYLDINKGQLGVVGYPIHNAVDLGWKNKGYWKPNVVYEENDYVFWYHPFTRDQVLSEAQRLVHINILEDASKAQWIYDISNNGGLYSIYSEHDNKFIMKEGWRNNLDWNSFRGSNNLAPAAIWVAKTHIDASENPPNIYENGYWNMVGTMTGDTGDTGAHMNIRSDVSWGIIPTGLQTVHINYLDVVRYEGVRSGYYICVIEEGITYDQEESGINWPTHDMIEITLDGKDTLQQNLINSEHVIVWKLLVMDSVCNEQFDLVTKHLELSEYVNSFIINSETTIRSNVDISGDLDLSGNMDIVGTSKLRSKVTLQDELEVSGNALFKSNIDISGNFDISGISNFRSKVILQDELEVSGIALLKSNLSVSGNVDVSDNLDISGISNFRSKVTLQDELEVSSNAFFNSNVDISGNLDVSGGLDVSGISNFRSKVTLQDEFEVSGNAFFNSNVDISGNLDISGGLDVSGISHFRSKVTLRDELEVSGNVSFHGHSMLNTLDASSIDASSIRVDGADVVLQPNFMNLHRRVTASKSHNYIHSSSHVMHFNSFESDSGESRLLDENGTHHQDPYINSTNGGTITDSGITLNQDNIAQMNCDVQGIRFGVPRLVSFSHAFTIYMDITGLTNDMSGIIFTDGTDDGGNYCAKCTIDGASILFSIRRKIGNTSKDMKIVYDSVNASDINNLTCTFGPQLDGNPNTNKLSLYVNGSQVGGQLYYKNVIPFDVSQNLSFGPFNADGIHLSNVTIFDKALSESEISNIVLLRNSECQLNVKHPLSTQNLVIDECLSIYKSGEYAHANFTCDGISFRQNGSSRMLLRDSDVSIYKPLKLQSNANGTILTNNEDLILKPGNIPRLTLATSDSNNSIVHGNLEIADGNIIAGGNATLGTSDVGTCLKVHANRNNIHQGLFIGEGDLEQHNNVGNMLTVFGSGGTTRINVCSTDHSSAGVRFSTSDGAWGVLGNEEGCGIFDYENNRYTARFSSNEFRLIAGSTLKVEDLNEGFVRTNSEGVFSSTPLIPSEIPGSDYAYDSTYDTYVSILPAHKFTTSTGYANIDVDPGSSYFGCAHTTGNNMIVMHQIPNKMKLHSFKLHYKNEDPIKIFTYLFDDHATNSVHKSLYMDINGEKSLILATGRSISSNELCIIDGVDDGVLWMSNINPTCVGTVMILLKTSSVDISEFYFKSVEMHYKIIE